MITLYELHWSHYCEKVRWALRLKNVEWRSVNINAFSKQELLPFAPGPSGLRLVPMIHDERTGRHVYESSAILRYLDENYGGVPLFPADEAGSGSVYRLLIELDTYLGLPARRLGYAQLIMECPAALSELFLPSICGGAFNLPGVRHVSSAVLGMMLLQRFNLHLNDESGLYEAVERYLETLQLRLQERRYLVGDTLTAADIALASQLRPLTIVPDIMEAPQLMHLFAWRARLIDEHGGESELLYQSLVARSRERSLPVRRRVRRATADISSMYALASGSPALNDQNRIWTLSTIKAPFWYFSTMRRNTYRG